LHISHSLVLLFKDSGQEYRVQHVRTELLDIAYEIAGPVDAPVIILLHGWPDDIGAWRKITPRLNLAGFRTIDGRGVALAQDAIDLADALGLERFAVIGHDWGARAAYFLASLFPARVSQIASVALAYQPKGAFAIPSFPQARRIWYQWFMCLEGGAEAVHRDPKSFARIQWDT
jgi:pimeloyl-ACP methyl ester carboxylesterase